jgi:hypothetical protein
MRSKHSGNAASYQIALRYQSGQAHWCCGRASLRHSSAALADPLRPSQHPALVQARRAFGAVPGGAQGISWNPHGALSVARCQSRAPHAMTSNNNAEGLARFLKLPPGASLRPRVEKQSLDRAVETPTYPGMSVFQVRLNSPAGAVVPAVAARSLRAICLLRSFSTVFAQAEALAATARSLRAMLSFSTVGNQSVASWSSRAACVLWSFSTAFGNTLPAACCPV